MFDRGVAIHVEQRKSDGSPRRFTPRDDKIKSIVIASLDVNRDVAIYVEQRKSDGSPCRFTPRDDKVENRLSLRVPMFDRGVAIHVE